MRLLLRAVLILTALITFVPSSHAQYFYQLQSTNYLWIYCYDGINVVPNCYVELQQSANPYANQHIHYGGTYPSSDVSPLSGYTGTSGLLVSVVTKMVGHQEFLEVWDNYGAPNYTIDWLVGVNGLGNLGTGSDWALVGQTTTHPDNHWGTDAAMTGVTSTAQQYHSEYPDYDVIGINDLSLPYGGTFDINGDWVPPHNNHSLGKAADIRGNGATNSVPRITDVQNRLMDICRGQGATIVLHESVGTSNEHFHCQWP